MFLAPPKLKAFSFRVSLIALVACVPSLTADISAHADDHVPPAKRLVVPGAAKRAEAEKLIREIYQKDFTAAARPAEKGALATRLLKQAAATKDDPVGRYALLMMSRELAVAAGDSTLTMSIIDQLAEVYEIDRRSEQAADLSRLAETAPNTSAQQALVAAGMTVIDEFAAEDEYAAAIKIARLCLAAARKAADAKLVIQVTDRG
jgi:hypothetical protein